MQFRFGVGAMDLTTRALYLVPVSVHGDVAHQITDAVDAGADGVIVHGPADSLPGALQIAAAAAPIPIAARAHSVATTNQRRASIEAGAALWIEGAEQVSPTLLNEFAMTEASLAVARCDRPLDLLALTQAAESAGLPLDRLAVVPTPEALSLAAGEALAAGVAVMTAPGDGPDRLGRQVVAMMVGARIIETTNVHEARRVGRTVSELLARRSLS